MFRKSLILAAALLAGTSLGALAQTVTPLTNGTPYDGTIYGFLLMDGTLLYQGGDLQDWWRFVPDKSGSYVNGTFLSRREPAGGLYSLRHLGGRLAGWTRAFDRRRISRLLCRVLLIWTQSGGAHDPGVRDRVC